MYNMVKTQRNYIKGYKKSFMKCSAVGRTQIVIRIAVNTLHKRAILDGVCAIPTGGVLQNVNKCTCEAPRIGGPLILLVFAHLRKY